MSFATWERAEALRVMLKMAPFLPDEDACLEVLTDDEFEVFEARDNDVVHLANACLDVEFEIRAHALAAIERLGSLVAGGEGDLQHRLDSMPQERFVLAAKAMHGAFWLYD